MKNFVYLNTFVEVARAGSFAAAARAMGMPRSTASLHVKTLEAELGTRLLKRSTRSLSLTEDGCLLFQEATHSLEALQSAFDRFQERTGKLEGLILITAPSDFPTGLLASAVADFHRRHPKIRFDLVLTNSTLDFVKDRIDIALGFSARSSGDRVVKELAGTRWRFFAGTEWLAANGEPRSLDDLHAFIAPEPHVKRLLEVRVLNGLTLPVSDITVNDQRMIRDLVVSGAGIALLPEGMMREPLETGHAQGVLHAFTGTRPAFSLEFPGRADILPRTREFARHLETYLTGLGIQ